MGKSLRADIIIGGKADNSFFQLGNSLLALGSQVNMVSEKLIQFGKESVKAYVSYEDAMLNTEVALRTQYQSTSELGKVMEQLNKSALQWANDSRFNTDDIANAISNAAHAGWDLEQIMEGIPAAMKISLAGSMGLAEGLEYLVDVSNAAKLDFTELGNLVDYWAYAANRSSTDIPEMGAAMQKMGATMQFVKGDMAGLTTMLAVLADNGTKGTEAGTLLRNSMIRLIAPTKAAASEMDDLRLTMEDLDDIYSNTAGMEEATEMLQEAGFSAYDANGDLKSFLETFQELNAATAEMSEQDRNKVLSAIFPTRTITGALALLDAASDKWGGLYEQIQQNSDGYAGYAAETMESGLGGSLRHLESVYNALQTRTGEALAPEVGAVTQVLSGLIENVNGMDDGKFNAVVSGLEAVAVAGPALMTAGGAIKLVEMLMGTGPIGQGILGGMALAALASGLHSLDNASYRNSFGNLSLNMDKVSAKVEAMGASFREAESEITRYNQAVETAFSDYATASGNLKEGLITSMIVGDKLTNKDKEEWYALGDQLGSAMISGVQNSFSEAMAAASMFADGGMLDGLMDTLAYGYNEAIAKAESLSSDLRKAMTSAFSDNALSSDEINNIQSIIDQQNKLMDMMAEAKNRTEREKMLRQGQTLGIGAASEIGTLFANQRDEELNTLQDNYWRAYESTQLSGMWKLENGVAGYTQASLDEELNSLGIGYNQKFRETRAEYDRMLLDTYTAAIQGSDLAQTFNLLNAVSSDYLSTGMTSAQKWSDYEYGSSLQTRRNTARFLEEAMDQFGGLDGLQKTIDYYNGIGDMSTANRFAEFMASYQYANDIGFRGNTPTAYDIEPNIAPIDESQLGTPTVEVEGDTTDLSAAIDAINGKVISVIISPQMAGGVGADGAAVGLSDIPMFYEGGRSTEPGIISEYGQAEWAIPEAHTQRTAELLNAARAASGFTWPELLSRNGGMNAGGGTGYTLVYSPTIITNDANGVAEKLKEDKARLQEWFDEKKLHDEVEAYV